MGAILTLDLASNTSTSVGDNYIFVILYSIRYARTRSRSRSHCGAVLFTRCLFLSVRVICSIDEIFF